MEPPFNIAAVNDIDRDRSAARSGFRAADATPILTGSQEVPVEGPGA
jgi:hypothetical protein